MEYDEKLTKNQLYYHEKTKLRDVVILTLFLVTGNIFTHSASFYCCQKEGQVYHEGMKE